FMVIPYRRELLVDGRATEVGGRAFDTLLALIDARGAVLSKDELMSRVWPDRVVEENNLHGRTSELRKASAPSAISSGRCPGEGISSRARCAWRRPLPRPHRSRTYLSSRPSSSAARPRSRRYCARTGTPAA